MTWPNVQFSAGRAIATLFLSALLLLPVPFASAAVPDSPAAATDRLDPEAEPGDDGDTTEPGDDGDTTEPGDDGDAGETGGTERGEATAPGPGDGEAEIDAESGDAASSSAPARDDDVPDGRGRRDSRRVGDRWAVDTGRVADPNADPLDGDPPAAEASSGEGSDRDGRTASDDASPSRIWPIRPDTFTFTQPFGCVPQLGGYYEIVVGCPADQPAVHTGIDLAAPTGTRIYAAAAGWVTEAGLDRPSGLANSRIVIQHEDRNDDFATEYLHWSVAYVRAGDYVRAGEPIAEVGSVGYSTGPHLHFSVVDFRTDERIDPVRWLPDDEASTEYRGLTPNRRPLRVRAQNQPVPDYADPNPAPVPEREPVPEADGDKQNDGDSDRGGGRSSGDSDRDGKEKGRTGRGARGDGDGDDTGVRDRGRRDDKRSDDDPERGDRRGRGATRDERQERGGDERAEDTSAPAEDGASDGERRGRSRSNEPDRSGRERERGGDRLSSRGEPDGAGRGATDGERARDDEARSDRDRDRDADAGEGGTDTERNGTRRDGGRQGGRDEAAEDGGGTSTSTESGVRLPPPVPAVPPVPPPVPPPSQAASDAPPAAEPSKDRQRSADGDQGKRRGDGS